MGVLCTWVKLEFAFIFFDCIKLRITAVYTPTRNVPVAGVLPYIQVGPKSGATGHNSVKSEPI